jgi:hypothetical protein
MTKSSLHSANLVSAAGIALAATEGDGLAAPITAVAEAPVAKAPKAPKEPAAPKEPSKKSIAVKIFAEKMVQRTAGVFTTNKDFRAAVLSTIEKDLGVSTASAATMYNAAKKEAEAADTEVGLGRDPKKVKAVIEGGKRGRPAGSKKKVAEAVATPQSDAVVAGAQEAGVEVTVAIATTNPVDMVGTPLVIAEDKPEDSPAPEAVAA